MALEVFYSYSHKDARLRERLEKHLSLLKRNGLIVNWHDRCIEAGQEWRSQINAHVRSAHIILLLISADFIASDYCYSVEMKVALERHRKLEAVVIPVILRPLDWFTAPFANLQALPRDGKPLTKWSNLDEAFLDVARGIRAAIARFKQSEQNDLTDNVMLDELIPEPRVVDAAIASHIVKDLGTKLLVLIRLPNSPGLCGILQTEQDTEARPEDVRSRPFHVIFPLGPAGKPDPLKVTVKLTSPDFSPPEQAKNIFVPPDADSDVCPFMLTPKRIGRLTVLVELFWEDAIRGYRSLATKCGADTTDASAQPEMNLVQMHLSVGTRPGGEKVTGGGCGGVEETDALNPYVQQNAPSAGTDIHAGRDVTPLPKPVERAHDSGAYKISETAPPPSQRRNRLLSPLWFVTMVAILAGSAYLVIPLRQAALHNDYSTPAIRITSAPFGDRGPEGIGKITGQVAGVEAVDYRVVVYAHTDQWYVQPTVDQAMTRIANNGTWNTETHSGDRYLALLVKSSYKPAPTLRLNPNLSEEIKAISEVAGTNR